MQSILSELSGAFKKFGWKEKQKYSTTLANHYVHVV